MRTIGALPLFPRFSFPKKKKIAPWGCVCSDWQRFGGINRLPSKENTLLKQELTRLGFRHRFSSYTPCHIGKIAPSHCKHNEWSIFLTTSTASTYGKMSLAFVNELTTISQLILLTGVPHIRPFTLSPFYNALLFDLCPFNWVIRKIVFCKEAFWGE